MCVCVCVVLTVFLCVCVLGCNAELGGFAGLFDLKAAGFTDPILVSGTDGVGTKLKVSSWFHFGFSGAGTSR